MPNSPFILLRVPALRNDAFSKLRIKDDFDKLDYELILQKAYLDLQELATNSDLIHGLKFSSYSFLASLQKFSKKEFKEFRKKEFQVARRLLDYLHRMSFNASPLSSFSKLQIRRKDWSKITPPEKQNWKLNSRIIDLLNPLIIDSIKNNSSLELQLNPYLEKPNQDYIYLRYNSNNEAEVCRVESSKELESICSMFRNDTLTLHDLLKVLSSSDKRPRIEWETIVFELIDLYFLIPAWEKLDMNQLKKLTSTLNIEKPIVINRAIDKEYIQPNDLEKKQEYIFNQFADSCEFLSKETSLFETVYTDENIERPDFVNEYLEREIHQVYSFVKRIGINDVVEPIGNSLLETFANWKEQNQTFYFKEYNCSPVRNGHLLDLSKEMTETEGLRLGVMLKNLPGFEKPYLVNWTTGYGKFFNSIFDDFAPELRSEYVSWKIPGSFQWVQNDDNSPHQSNIINENFDKVSSLTFGKSLNNVQSVRLGLNEETQLINRENGNVLHVLDLGIQSPKSRSKFYRFLNQFSPLLTNLKECMYSFSSVLKESREECTFYPRIESESMILSLASWEFKKMDNFIDLNLDGQAAYQALHEKAKQYLWSGIMTYHSRFEPKRYIDLDNPISVDTFLRRLRKMKGNLTLTEFSKNPSKRQDNNHNEYYWEFDL